MLGIKQSVVLMLLKALMSWLIYTNMQAMFYSLAGGALSLLAMIALSRIKSVSVIGVSAPGAVAFHVGQIPMAAVILSFFGRFTTEELTQIRMKDNTKHLYEDMQERDDEKAVQVLKQLDSFRVKAERYQVRDV